MYSSVAKSSTISEVFIALRFRLTSQRDKMDTLNTRTYRHMFCMEPISRLPQSSYSREYILGSVYSGGRAGGLGEYVDGFSVLICVY